MRTALAAAVIAATTACNLLPDREVEGPPRKERIFAVTEGNKLIVFNAGQPQKATVVGTITGLEGAEKLDGIDFRVARGILYGLGSSGRLYTLDTKTAAAQRVGEPLPFNLRGKEFGFDFNPTVDRIRIVTEAGQSLRAHPDTGAAVDGDPGADGLQMDGALVYATEQPESDPRKPRVVAAAYTYNKMNEKVTTNYVIDAQHGTLVMQGSKEGATPVVSPNTGRLTTVGPLGVSSFTQAHFDIADVTGAAFVAINYGSASRLYLVDLGTGAATRIGTIGGGERVRGISVEP